MNALLEKLMFLLIHNNIRHTFRILFIYNPRISVWGKYCFIDSGGDWPSDETTVAAAAAADVKPVPHGTIADWTTEPEASTDHNAGWANFDSGNFDDQSSKVVTETTWATYSTIKQVHIDVYDTIIGNQLYKKGKYQHHIYQVITMSEVK